MTSEGSLIAVDLMTIEIGTICLAHMNRQDVIVKTVYWDEDSDTWLCSFLDAEVETHVYLDEDRLEPIIVPSVEGLGGDLLPTDSKLEN